MRYIKENLYFVISLFITIIISTVIFIQLKSDFFPDSAIQKKGNQYATSFVTAAKTVEVSLLDLQNTIDTSHFFQLQKEEKMKFLIDKLKENSNISGFMILDHSGRLTSMFKDQGTFIFASDSASKVDNIVWHRVDKSGKVINEWTMALGYELNLLPEDSKLLNKSLSSKSSQWTSSDFLIGDPNSKMVNYVSWHSESTGRLMSCIAVVDESNFVARATFFYDENFQSILMDDENGILSLDEANLCDTSYYKDNVCAQTYKSWQLTGAHIPGTFSFMFKKQNWWGQTIAMDINGISAIIISNDQQRLYYSSISDHRLALILVLILLIITSVLYYRTFKKHHQSLDEFTKGKENDIVASELIKLGETSYVEFKSSFRYDYVQQMVNKDLESVIAKSIAAFSNAEGGTLLIGVDDDGNVLGLEKDILTLKRKDLDFFENTLRMFLNKTFKVSFVTQYLEMKFPVINQKAICRIDVAKGHDPVFVEINKKGSKSERFYVRSGNTSQEIVSLREINTYIKSRFSSNSK